jgi:hypothetical protein
VTGREFRDVLARYPELGAGLADHLDEVMRIARRILKLEAHPRRTHWWVGKDKPPVERARLFDELYPSRSAT